MLKISAKRKEDFKQDKEYVLTYLKSRNVNDTDYLKLIEENDFGFLEENTFYVDGYEYSVDAFCTCSQISGLDIKGVNKNHKTDTGGEIVIAGVWGDDAICMNINTGEILLWLIETGEWEKVHVANSFKEFISQITYV